jgi:hypothetical protein
MATQSTALVKPDETAIERASRGLAPESTTDVETFARQIVALKDRVNLLTPLQAVGSIPALHEMTWTVVKVNPDPQGPDVYFSKIFHEAGQVSLSKIALLNLASASGARILPAIRTDDRSDPHFCSMSATVLLYGPDGWRPVSGSRQLDLRDGSQQIKHLKPGQIAGQRSHIAELCETFAIERALRSAFSLQGAYTKKELEKPFFIVKLQRRLDMNDPDQKALALELYKSAETALFGPPQMAPATTEERPQLDAPPPLKASPVERLPRGQEPPEGAVEAEVVNDQIDPDRLAGPALRELLGIEASELAKVRKCGASEIIKEASKLPNGKTFTDPSSIESDKWVRYALKRMRESAAKTGEPSDEEIPE